MIDRIRDKLYVMFGEKWVDIGLARGMVSFTFDDFPANALTAGGRILEDHGARGTYYTCMGLLGKETEVGAIVSEAGVRECVERGHEVANHTCSHLNCVETPVGTVVGDIRENSRRLPAGASRNFAYPFGYSDIRAERNIGPLVATARGTEVGINAKAANPRYLLANPVYSVRGLDQPLAMTRQNIETRGWLIFYTHDVTENPSRYGCTPADFRRLVEAVKETGQDIVTVEEGRRRLGL